MARECIEREAVENVIEGLAGGFDYIECGWKYAVGKIRDVPAADVVPVRHGRWKPHKTRSGKNWWECSACDYVSEHKAHHNYCPKCGALMDKGGD